MRGASQFPSCHFSSQLLRDMLFGLGGEDLSFIGVCSSSKKSTGVESKMGSQHEVAEFAICSHGQDVDY